MSLSKLLWTKIWRTGNIYPGERMIEEHSDRGKDINEGLLVGEERSRKA